MAVIDEPAEFSTEDDIVLTGRISELGTLYRLGGAEPRLALTVAGEPVVPVVDWDAGTWSATLPAGSLPASARPYDVVLTILDERGEGQGDNAGFVVFVGATVNIMTIEDRYTDRPVEVRVRLAAGTYADRTLLVTVTGAESGAAETFTVPAGAWTEDDEGYLVGTLTGLSAGTYTVNATFNDGNSARDVSAEPVTFTMLEYVAPRLELAPSGPYWSDDTDMVVTGTVSGAGDAAASYPPATVHVTVDGKPYERPFVVAEDGSFSIDLDELPGGLAAGSHDVVVSTTDGVEQTRAALTVDVYDRTAVTVAPTTDEVYEGLDERLVTGTYVQGSGPDALPTITVHDAEGDVVAGAWAVEDTGDGTWSANLGDVLSAGTYTVVASAPQAPAMGVADAVASQEVVVTAWVRPEVTIGVVDDDGYGVLADAAPLVLTGAGDQGTFATRQSLLQRLVRSGEPTVDVVITPADGGAAVTRHAKLGHDGTWTMTDLSDQLGVGSYVATATLANARGAEATAEVAFDVVSDLMVEASAHPVADAERERMYVRVEVAYRGPDGGTVVVDNPWATPENGLDRSVTLTDLKDGHASTVHLDTGKAWIDPATDREVRVRVTSPDGQERAEQVTYEAADAVTFHTDITVQPYVDPGRGGAWFSMTITNQEPESKLSDSQAYDGLQVEYGFDGYRHKDDGTTGEREWSLVRFDDASQQLQRGESYEWDDFVDDWNLVNDVIPAGTATFKVTRMVDGKAFEEEVLVDYGGAAYRPPAALVEAPAAVVHGETLRVEGRAMFGTFRVEQAVMRVRDAETMQVVAEVEASRVDPPLFGPGGPAAGARIARLQYEASFDTAELGPGRYTAGIAVADPTERPEVVARTVVTVLPQGSEGPGL